MIFASIDTADAEGALLGHGQLVGAVRWSKGRLLDADDIVAARAAGLTSLTVARLGPADVAEADAAARLGAALAGPGVTALPPAHGRVNLAAAVAGLVIVDVASVDRLNAVDEALTLGTLAPFARVAAGDIIATVKIIPYAVEAALLAAALDVVPLRVAAFRAVTVDLIQTTLPVQSDKAQAKTEAVTRARLITLGVIVGRVAICAHDAAALADLLHAPTGAAITLVTGASATVDRRDVIPAAIAAAGGRVERLGMPVDPGNLLCLGRVGERAVIGLPGCARSPKRNGFDWVLERLVAGLAVTTADIAGMGVGGLLPEAERPQPRLARAASPGIIGAVILAAGRSTRMGGPSKLVADLGGRPVVAHVVAAALAAGLARPVVVVGDRAAAVRAALAGAAVDFVEAADFADGLSASLRAGLGAAPSQWRAALVLLGDMPRVGPATLRALAAAATDDSVIAVPIHAGKRGNPVLWGAAHFASLRGLAGDVGGKALLSEHAGRVVEVAVDDGGILVDVDTPAALAGLREKFGANGR